MSCPRSTTSTESAAICLRASGRRWVIACPAREDTAAAPRSSFQPITRLWQFEGLSAKHGPLFEPCPPKAKVTRSSRVGCASFFWGSVPDTWVTVYTDDIGNTFCPKRICDGLELEPASLIVEVSQIMVHKADEPNPIVGLFDSDGLPGEDLAEI